MTERQYKFSFDEFDTADELAPDDQALLKKAREVTATAYAPYSNFYVGAAARLTTGEIMTGTNQENASFPVGICAERVLLAAISSVKPGVAVESLAVSFSSQSIASNHPITPCGMCRQALQEFEQRTGHSIRLLLAGMEGQVYIIQSASLLLPLAFTSTELT